MNGNVSTVEGLKQCCELVGSVAKAMALVAPNMSKEQRQALIGMPPAELALVLEKGFLPVKKQAERLDVSGYDRHGHRMFRVTNQNLTGEQVIACSHMRHKPISAEAHSCLMSKTKKSFNNRPQFVCGSTYRVVLVPVLTDHRFIEKVQSKYGYRLPPTDVLPHMFCQLSIEQLIKAGFDYIGAEQTPVENEIGTPHCFYLSLTSGRSSVWLNAKRECDVVVLDQDGSKRCAMVFLTD